MRAIPRTPSLSQPDAERLLEETQGLRKAAVKRHSYIAAVQLLNKETELLAEIELHRKVALEAEQITDEAARQRLLEALPSLPLPVLEAALTEYAQRLGLDRGRLAVALSEAAAHVQ